MLNFILGALAMWFVLGSTIFICDSWFHQDVMWSVPFYIVMCLPAMLIIIPTGFLIRALRKIYEAWNNEWKWKFEEIKEKIKYRY